MRVKYLQPSELDATVESCDTGLDISPRFFTPSGPAVLGVLVSRNSAGTVLDRVTISVNGKGKISMLRRTAEVQPHCDQQEALDPIPEQEAKSNG